VVLVSREFKKARTSKITNVRVAGAATSVGSLSTHTKAPETWSEIRENSARSTTSLACWMTQHRTTETLPHSRQRRVCSVLARNRRLNPLKVSRTLTEAKPGDTCRTKRSGSIPRGQQKRRTITALLTSVQDLNTSTKSKNIEGGRIKLNRIEGGEPSPRIDG